VNRRRSLRACTAFLLAVCAGAAAAGDTFALRGSVIAGGGGTSRSALGCLALDGTVAENAAGASGAGAFTLRAGFWGGPGRVRRDGVFESSFEECR
jgi:hypothetical protein